MLKICCDEPEVTGLSLRLRPEPGATIESFVHVIGSEWVGTITGLIVPAHRKAGDYRECIMEHMRAKDFRRIRWSRHRPNGTVEWKEFDL